MLKNSLTLIPARRDHHQAKWLFATFIASLGMFFLATLATYVLIRTQIYLPIQRAYQPLSMPTSFWFSTACLFATSIFLERAVWFVRRERQQPFQVSLWIAAAFSLLFLVTQQEGMTTLALRHYDSIDGSTKFFGICFVLVLVHALHVAGGLIFLGYIIYGARRGRYDHERHWSVNHCAGYWHFLDIVWLAMVLTFWITG
jgi:cytochrome c oxidase subunit III